MDELSLRRDLLDQIELVPARGQHRDAGLGRCQEDQRIVQALLSPVRQKALRARERAGNHAGIRPDLRVRGQKPACRHGSEQPGVVIPKHGPAKARRIGICDTHCQLRERVLRTAQSFPRTTTDRGRHNICRGYLTGAEARSRARLARPVDCENPDHPLVLVAPCVGVHLEDDAVRPVPPPAADQRAARARRPVNRSVSVRQDAQPPRSLRNLERTGRLSP